MVYLCFPCIVMVLQPKFKSKKNKNNIISFSFLSTSKLACVEGAAEGRKEGEEEDRKKRIGVVCIIWLAW